MRRTDREGKQESKRFRIDEINIVSVLIVASEKEIIFYRKAEYLKNST